MLMFGFIFWYHGKTSLSKDLIVIDSCTQSNITGREISITGRYELDVVPGYL